MKTVLITGGCGFIGHHIIEYFLDKTDYNIVSLDRLDFSGNLNRLNDILKNRNDKERVKIVYHDLRSPINQQIKSLIGNVNIILHLAASSHVTRSIVNPLEFVENNVIGTVNLLNFARELKNLERFLYFSTDEVFGPAYNNTVSFTEYDRYNSTSPYSASKAAAEELCVAFQNTYNLPIIITHTMNVYGERQATEKFIPLVLKKLKNGELIHIHYNSITGLTGSRSYLYAKDVAKAILFILNHKCLDEFPVNSNGSKCHKFNIAAKEQHTNIEIFNYIIDALSFLSDINFRQCYKLIDPNIEKDRPGHDFKYNINGDYLRSLGWSEDYELRKQIPEIAKWYFNNKEWLN